MIHIVDSNDLDDVNSTGNFNSTFQITGYFIFEKLILFTFSTILTQ